MINKIIALIKSKEFQKFFVIGVSAFAIDFILLQIFLKIFNIQDSDHVKETVANLASSGISIAYNFTVQRKWAFKSSNNVAGEAGKFIGVQAFNLVVFQTVLFSVVNYFLPAWITKIGVTGVQLSVSFLLYKFFVFKSKPTSQVIEATIETSAN